MIRRTSKYFVMAALVSFASYANAAGTVVTPSLAACSKALIESMTKSEAAPTYKVKAPSPFVSDLVDPNAFTVIARHTKTNQVLAKASCKATSAGEILSFRSIPVKS
ncbi:MAG TPA: hypothetical protein VFU13_12370 [Steroidobacteraceae bacterium]|nr:hypothetical protein [Steroidobacteraceae bacterium]